MSSEDKIGFRDQHFKFMNLNFLFMEEKKKNKNNFTFQVPRHNLSSFPYS